MRILSCTAIGCLLAAAAPAADYAVLHTGARIRAERWESVGDRVRLHTEGGKIELPSAAVARFEPIEASGAEPKPVERPKPEPDKSIEELVDELAERAKLHPALVHSVISPAA